MPSAGSEVSTSSKRNTSALPKTPEVIEPSTIDWSKEAIKILAPQPNRDWPIGGTVYGGRYSGSACHRLKFENIPDQPTCEVCKLLRDAGLMVVEMRDPCTESQVCLPVLLSMKDQVTEDPIHLSYSVVGIIAYGRVYKREAFNLLLDCMIQDRTELGRQAASLSRLFRREPEEILKLSERASTLHKQALLVGILAGVPPVEAMYRVAVAMGGTLNAGSLTLAVKANEPSKVEVALPPFRYYYNSYQHARPDERESGKEFKVALEALRKDVETLGVSCTSEVFCAAHRYESDEYTLPILHIPREVLDATLDCVRRRFERLYS